MDQEPSELDQSLRRTLGGNAPDAVQQRAQVRFAEFTNTNAAGPRSLGRRLLALAATNESIHSHNASPRARWWWWLGGGLAGSAVATAVLFFLVVTPSPSWAQVTAKFRALRYFNATVFVTDAAGQPPERIDVWVAPDNRLRAHYRDLIFFGTDGRIERVLSSTSGQAVDLTEVRARVRDRELAAQENLPALELVANLARLGESAELNLDRLVALLRGRRDQLAPAPLAAPELADDLRVFDLANEHSSQWARIWVLPRRELPLRLRLWDASDAGQIEMLFDYSTRLPDDAFDARRVAQALTQTTGAANRLYAALLDPGERPLTPAAVLAGRSAPPLPEIDSVGRTPEGVIWVLSRRAENLRPDGELVAGWDSLVDSLGQTYQRQLIGWLPVDQLTLEFFVPANLSQDFRLPQSYSLQCRARATDGTRSGAPLASLSVAQWLESAAIPDLGRAARNEVGGRVRWELCALDEAADQLAWEDFEQLAAHIPGEPESDPVALSRDLKRIGCLQALQRANEAARLASRLYPLISPALLRDEPLASAVVRLHLAQLFRAGQRDQARRLANVHAHDALQRSRLDGPMFVASLLVELRAAGLSETDARTFFDHDLFALPAVRARTEQLQSLQPPTIVPAASGRS